MPSLASGTDCVTITIGFAETYTDNTEKAGMWFVFERARYELYQTFRYDSNLVLVLYTHYTQVLRLLRLDSYVHTPCVPKVPPLTFQEIKINN